MALKKIIILSALAVIFVSGIFICFKIVRSLNGIDTKHNKEVEASSAQATPTSQLDWQTGVYTDGIDLASSPGDIKLTSSGQIDLISYGAANPDRISVGEDSANKLKAIDDNIATKWDSETDNPGWWKIDLGESFSLTKVRCYPNATVAVVYGSNDDSSYTQITIFTPATEEWHEFSFTDNYRYIKIEGPQSPPEPATNIYLYEVQLFGMPTSATHTTGATQIDGGENFWSWEGFTPTDSKPANTSITYRYRTSTDGAIWTAWVADIGSVTSRTGDDSNDPTLYRYLQAEATLANTDGASTPTIDAYDIDYHTEVKPSKPTAQTAVAQ
ncbi:MAG: discoidin domain-containing protein [bacterium]